MAASSGTKTAKRHLEMALTGDDRATFLRLTKACAHSDQVKRITARLSLTKFINTHGMAACKATEDDILRRARARK